MRRPPRKTEDDRLFESAAEDAWITMGGVCPSTEAHEEPNKGPGGPGSPDGWRVSGERGGEADERVRCTCMLGGGALVLRTP